MPETTSKAGRKKSIADKARQVREKVKNMGGAKRPGRPSPDGGEKAKAKADALNKR